MGAQATKEQLDARRQSKALDKQLKVDHKLYEKQFKLLILGEF